MAKTRCPDGDSTLWLDTSLPQGSLKCTKIAYLNQDDIQVTELDLQAPALRSAPATVDPDCDNRVGTSQGTGATMSLGHAIEHSMNAS